MRNIGEAVEFLHGINIAHRDLKVSYCIAIIKHQHYITLYTIVQKFGVSNIYLLILYSKNAINWAKVSVNTSLILILKISKYLFLILVMLDNITVFISGLSKWFYNRKL